MNFSFQLYRSGQPNWKYTVWEFQNFDTTQILREINFGHLRSSEFWIFRFNYTDLDSPIGNTQCGNFRILRPLKSYVKSILVIWSPKKCHFDHLRSSEFSIFWYSWHFQVRNSQKIKIHRLENCSNNSFCPSEISQYSFHTKSEWQENGYFQTVEYQ